MTLDQQLQNYGERSPGFDLCRIVLAIAVFASHSITAAYGEDVQRQVWLGPIGIVLSAIMPMFFAISGFLVMGSAVRLNHLRSFMAARGLRIVPALMTQTVVLALLLGPMLTDLSLSHYRSDSRFYAYLLNSAGLLHYGLPGVFAHNPTPDVINGSLWTIPAELTCYLYLGLMMLFRFRLAAFVASTCLLFAANAGYEVIAYLHHAPPHQVPTSRYLFLAFTAGNLLFLLRDRMPYRFNLFAVITATGLLMLKTNALMAPAVLCLSYTIVYIGCSGLKLPVDLRGDYSYGIYVYGFPVQQAVAALFPSGRSFLGNLLISFPITCICAVASWWLVEKPALDLRKLLPKRAKPAEVRTLPSMLVWAVPLAVYAAELMRNSHFPNQQVNPNRAFVLSITVVVTIAATVLRWSYLRRTASDPAAGQGSRPAASTIGSDLISMKSS